MKEYVFLRINDRFKDYINGENEDTKGYTTSDIKSTLTKDRNSLKKRQEGNILLIESKQKELDEANRLKQDSSVTMRSKRHKLKWGVEDAYQKNFCIFLFDFCQPNAIIT